MNCRFSLFLQPTNQFHSIRLLGCFVCILYDFVASRMFVCFFNGMKFKYAISIQNICFFFLLFIWYLESLSSHLSSYLSFLKFVSVQRPFLMCSKIVPFFFCLVNFDVNEYDFNNYLQLNSFWEEHNQIAFDNDRPFFA